MKRALVSVAAILLAGVVQAQEVTPGTSPVDSPYGSTSAPETSSGGTRDAVLHSRGDPNPTSMGDGHALSEAVTAGAPNQTPTPGAAPAPRRRTTRMRAVRRRAHSPPPTS